MHLMLMLPWGPCRATRGRRYPSPPRIRCPARYPPELSHEMILWKNASTIDTKGRQSNRQPVLARPNCPPYQSFLIMMPCMCPMMEPFRRRHLLVNHLAKMPPSRRIYPPLHLLMPPCRHGRLSRRLPRSAQRATTDPSTMKPWRIVATRKAPEPFNPTAG